MPIDFAEMDRDIGRARVPYYICERLLKNTKKGGAEILVQGGFTDVRLNLAPDAGAVLKFSRLPLEGGHESEVV